jgi:transposase-like protein
VDQGFPRFSKEMDEHIAARYIDGENVKDISKDVGISSNGCRIALAREGVKIRNSGPGTKPPRRKHLHKTTIIEDYEGGMSIRDTATKHGVNPYTAKIFLLEHGVHVRSRLEQVSIPKYRRNQEESVRLWNEGKSVQEIAAYHGCPQYSVWKDLHSAGINPGEINTYHRRYKDHTWEKPDFVSDRNWSMFNAVIKDNRSLSDVAREHGVTRQRVDQLIKRILSALEG